MGAIYDVLAGIAPPHDPELAEGYQRYESLLTTVLTPEQMDEYAKLIQHAGAVRVFEELTTDELADLSPDEDAIATAIIANETASMENRRVASLLNQRGEHEVAPDLDDLPQIDPQTGAISSTS